MMALVVLVGGASSTLPQQVDIDFAMEAMANLHSEARFQLEEDMLSDSQTLPKGKPHSM